MTNSAAKQFATVGTFGDETEAVIARQFLEGVGIHAFIIDSSIASIVGHAGIGAGRIMLQAELSDADEARELIAQARSGELAWDQEELRSIGGPEDDDVEAETETEKKRQALDWKSLLLLAVADPKQLDSALRSGKVRILNEFLAKPPSFFVKIYIASVVCALAVFGVVVTIVHFFS